MAQQKKEEKEKLKKDENEKKAVEAEMKRKWMAEPEANMQEMIAIQKVKKRKKKRQGESS